MRPSLTLIGGKVLGPDDTIETVDLHIADGLIVEAKPANSSEIDCHGCHVLPGIIDVHGDAFEGELFPRPDVDVPFDIAMRSVDRQLLANGITTAFHGLSLSWEPGTRGMPAARRFMSKISELRPSLVADHRVQLRWETFAHDAISDIATWLSSPPAPAIAFNDHITETLAAIEAGDARKLDKWAQRSGLSRADYVEAAKAVSANAANVPSKMREVATLAKTYSTIMLGHDESTLVQRAAHRRLGMTISEFPLTEGVAKDAIANGENVVMGAPNAMRGLSHKGDMSAEEAIREGGCTVLASDYYYPSLLHAAEQLVRRDVCTMSDAWALISANPARAMGLTDRGALELGSRADVVVVDCAAEWRLVHTIARGAVTSLSR